MVLNSVYILNQRTRQQLLLTVEVRLMLHSWCLDNDFTNAFSAFERLLATPCQSLKLGGLPIVFFTLHALFHPTRTFDSQCHTTIIWVLFAREMLQKGSVCYHHMCIFMKSYICLYVGHLHACPSQGQRTEKKVNIVWIWKCHSNRSSKLFIFCLSSRFYT